MVVPALLLAFLCGCGVYQGVNSDPEPPVDTAVSHPPRRFVYAHYMHCFVFGDTSVQTGSEDWTSWTRREFDSPSWWPEQYSSCSQAGETSIRQDFEWAQDAGLDAFGVLTSSGDVWWAHYGPTLDSIADVASTTTVKILPDIWVDGRIFAGSSDENITRAIQFGNTVKRWMNQHPGAFASIDGKPVISVGFGTDASASQISQFSHLFDPWGGPEKLYIIASSSGANVGAWSEVASAFTSWPVSQSWSGGFTAEWLFAAGASQGRDIAFPVVAAYFETHHPWPNRRMMAEDLGVTKYIDKWEEALRHRSRLVQVQTWNDFNEDTAITNLNVRGTSLIDLTAYLSQWFHQGAPPAIETDRVFMFHHRQLTTTRYTQATEIAITPSWASDTPTTDYINVVALLTAPARATVSDGTSQWSIELPAGMHQWLLYVRSKNVTDGGSDGPAFLHPDSYPVSNSERTVTTVKAFATGTPTIILTRNGRVIAAGASRTGWPSQARWQDMSLIGDEFVGH